MQGLELPDAAAARAAIATTRSAALSAGPSAPAATGLDPALLAAAAAETGLGTIALWLRFSAARLLTWNRNYNVKPREVSAAQDRVTLALTHIWLAHPWARRITEIALGAVGRGGTGNMGQRIRDEILAIQQQNGTKGGMMEQWHQKLHNNTSPDDVVICSALLAYIDRCFPSLVLHLAC